MRTHEYSVTVAIKSKKHGDESEFDRLIRAESDIVAEHKAEVAVASEFEPGVVIVRALRVTRVG